MLLEFWDSLSEYWERVTMAYGVLTGTYLAVPIGDPDTVIAYAKIDGSRVEDFYLMAAVRPSELSTSYTKQLANIFTWAGSKPKHYWNSTDLGIQVRDAAASSIEEDSIETYEMDLPTKYKK